jgi:hypothetical protein
MAEFGTAILEEGSLDRPGSPQPSSKVGALPLSVVLHRSRSFLPFLQVKKSIKKIHTENPKKAVALLLPVYVQFSSCRGVFYRLTSLYSVASPSHSLSRRKDHKAVTTQFINPV